MNDLLDRLDACRYIALDVDDRTARESILRKLDDLREFVAYLEGADK